MRPRWWDVGLLTTDLVVSGDAHVAVFPLRVVLTILADSSAGLAAGREHSGVVVTLVCVLVTVTFLALVLHLPSGRSPGNILVEILTLLTVIAPEVSIDVSQNDKLRVIRVPTQYCGHSYTSREPSQ